MINKKQGNHISCLFLVLKLKINKKGIIIIADNHKKNKF